MPAPLTAKPPRGVLRWMLRLPVLLYRMGLGWMLGERFLLLNHIGRKTGQPRQTVVEVVKHDHVDDTYYIVSGWGHKANWYQNLLATPAITIQVGRRNLAVKAETLSPEKGAEILQDYRRQQPLAARELSRLLGIDFFQSTPSRLEEIVRKSLPVVALRPLRDHTQDNQRQG